MAEDGLLVGVKGETELLLGGLEVDRKTFQQSGGVGEKLQIGVDVVGDLFGGPERG